MRDAQKLAQNVFPPCSWSRGLETRGRLQIKPSGSGDKNVLVAVRGGKLWPKYLNSVLSVVETRKLVKNVTKFGLVSTSIYYFCFQTLKKKKN